MTEITIKARANGPYKVEGPVRVIDSEGIEFVLPAGSAIVLCRCGHSRNKPGERYRALPLRALAEQAVLRLQPQAGRLCLRRLGATRRLSLREDRSGFR